VLRVYPFRKPPAPCNAEHEMQMQREEEEREKANSFLLHALRIYTTCTHRPLRAKPRSAQQDPDATRFDDIVQCSAVHLQAVIKSRYSSAQASVSIPIEQYGSTCLLFPPTLLPCTGLYRLTPRLPRPGVRAPRVKQVSVIEVAVQDEPR
jgi:hypothetical protein